MEKKDIFVIVNGVPESFGNNKDKVAEMYNKLGGYVGNVVLSMIKVSVIINKSYDPFRHSGQESIAIIVKGLPQNNPKFGENLNEKVSATLEKEVRNFFPEHFSVTCFIE